VVQVLVVQVLPDQFFHGVPPGTFDLAALRLETQLNRDISQMAPELALIIGAFRNSCKTDAGY
jgi:hypothetical protein